MIHKLEVDSVQLSFGNKIVLSDVYIKSETNKITGFLGRNGSGKSCLMQAIYGNLPCEKSVRFDGISVFKAFENTELLAYLPQFNFIPKNLSLKRVFFDFGLDFLEFLKLFPEFNTQLNSKIGFLSGGNFRIVEVYCIVKSKANFIMLDEPFSHISPIQIDKIKQVINIEKSLKGIIISDHMYRHVIDVCDEIYVLKNGKVYKTNTLNDLEALGYTKS
jgi:ABC-type lipopolysaccharide export system ATPase subunit